MKTLRRLMVVALLLGAYHAGFAQSNSVPEFKSDAEKQAWVQTHPESSGQKIIGEKKAPNVRSNEKFSSDLEKQAWIDANGAAYEADKAAFEPSGNIDRSKERFSSDAEKQAWLEAGGSAELKSEWSQFKPVNNRVLSTEKYSSDAEKMAAQESK